RQVVAHGGDIDKRRRACRVVHQYPIRQKGNLCNAAALIEPGQDRGYGLFAFVPLRVAQHILEQQQKYGRQTRERRGVDAMEVDGVVGVSLNVDLLSIASGCCMHDETTAWMIGRRGWWCLFDLDAGILDDPAKKLRLLRAEFAELGGSHRCRLRALVLQRLHDFWIVKSLYRGGIQLGDDRIRSTGCGEQAEPVDQYEILQPRDAADGWDIRKRAHGFVRRNTHGLDLAGL